MEVQQVLEAEADEARTGRVLEAGALVAAADGADVGVPRFEAVEAVGSSQVVDQIQRVQHVDAVGRDLDRVDDAIGIGDGRVAGVDIGGAITAVVGVRAVASLAVDDRGREPRAPEELEDLAGLEVDAEDRLDALVGDVFRPHREVGSQEAPAGVGVGTARGRVLDFDRLDRAAARRERITEDGTDAVDRPLVGARELDQQVPGVGVDLGAPAVDHRREREEADLVVDRGIPLEALEQRRVLCARVVGLEHLGGRHLGVEVQRDEPVAVGVDAAVGDGVGRRAGLTRVEGRVALGGVGGGVAPGVVAVEGRALQHRQIVDADGGLRPLAAHRRVQFLLQLDQRVEGCLAQIDAADDRAGHVGPFVGHALVDAVDPVGVVRLGNVDAGVVAVLIAQRAGDALHRKAVEAVGGELELEFAVVGFALVLETEVEQVGFQLLVALLVVTGQRAEFVGVDVDDGHQ